MHNDVASRSFRSGLCLLLGGLLSVACTGGESIALDNSAFAIKEGQPFAFQGVGQLAFLSPDDRAIYLSDRQYVRKLLASGTATALNHADVKQHRFVLMRLKLAGKTPANSPQLFQRIADLRATHLAKGYKEGTVIQSGGTTGLENQHYLPAVNAINAHTVEVVATASRKDALYYGYVDSGVWDSDGVPIGNNTYSEIYGNMPYGNSRTTGDLTLTQLNTFEGDSFMAEDTVSYGYRESYTVYVGERNGPTFSRIQVNDPSDIRYGDHLISVCLDRSWTNDCDYDLSGMWTLKLPLSGSITLPSAYSIDESKINNEYKTGHPGGGSIMVTLATNGGGCSLTDNTTMLPITTFWNHTTVSSDKKTLSWHLTGKDAADFSHDCRLVQDQVVLTMHIPVPWTYTNGTGGAAAQVMITSDKNVISASSNFIIQDPIKITNSCLAAGSMVELADGQSKPVQELKIGDRLRNPYAPGTSALTVTDIAKGVENPPMVRIADDGGRKLLLTEMHPVPVADRGMVTAKNLRVGDTVMTRNGPSHLVQVTREKFDGKVYNFKLGTPDEVLRLGRDQTVAYANGFLVGDGQIQSKLETFEQTAKQVASRAKLPARWRQDYQNSLKHAKAL